MDIWEKPFSKEMLRDSENLIISCPQSSLVKELFHILRESGVTWGTGDTLDISESYWERYKKEMCYRVRPDRTITFGSKPFYSREQDYARYAKCTFYGEDTTFEPASDDDLRALIGI